MNIVIGRYAYLFIFSVIIASCAPPTKLGVRLQSLEDGRRVPDIVSVYDVRALTEAEFDTAQIDSLPDSIMIATFTQHIFSKAMPGGSRYNQKKMARLEERIRQRNLLVLDDVEALDKSFLRIGMPAWAVMSIIRANDFYLGPEVISHSRRKNEEKWLVGTNYGVYFHACIRNGRLYSVSRARRDPDIRILLQDSFVDDRHANPFLWGYGSISNTWHFNEEQQERVGRC